LTGNFLLSYLKSYGKFIIMDQTNLTSQYCKMFMLEKYDKNLFELVPSALPY